MEGYYPIYRPRRTERQALGWWRLRFERLVYSVTVALFSETQAFRVDILRSDETVFF